VAQPATFTAADLSELEAAGISPDDASAQLRFLTAPPRHANLVRPCTLGDGIRTLESVGVEEALAAYERARAESRFLKFVPASGAATRMFQSLLRFLHEEKEYTKAEIEAGAGEGTPHFAELARFIDGLTGGGRGFAFRDRLADRLREDGRDLSILAADKRYRPILEALLVKLGYASLPKGLLLFHASDDGARTAFEEHLIEATLYARNADGVCRLHFTVSPEHEAGFRARLAGAGPGWEKRLGVRYEVSFSAQKPSTDTIAVDDEGRPFRDKSGGLLRRPGGHGALIENLNDVAGDIIFIKNIDNVTPRQLDDDLVTWKKALAGLLAHVQARAFRLLARLEAADDRALPEAEAFAGESFGISPPPGSRSLTAESLRSYWLRKLRRPIRVAGMVPNAGHAGGGPFWVRGVDGALTLQVVESAEVDPDSPEQQAIFRSSTHFSPVDFVCAVRAPDGEPYDLKQFVDPEAVFVSSKSYEGRRLRALERPGLWNGGMADWNTIFVEVPAETFAPVKKVTDLLNEDHQGGGR
jgi:hypothetical protein